MDPQRETLLHDLEALDDRGEALVRRHPHREFHWKPAPKRWSMAECMEHMTVSLRLYLPSFENALARGGPRGEGPYTWGPLARGWIRLVGPGGPRLFTPPSMKPTSIPRPAPRQAPGHPEEVPTLPPPAEYLADFREGNARLAAMIRASEGLDLARIRTRSPVIPLLRFSLGAWFETCIAHTRRHMDQAEGVGVRLMEVRTGELPGGAGAGEEEATG